VGGLKSARRRASDSMIVNPVRSANRREKVDLPTPGNPQTITSATTLGFGRGAGGGGRA